MTPKFKLTIEPIKAETLPFPKYMYGGHNGEIVYFQKEKIGVQINVVGQLTPHYHGNWDMSSFTDCPDQSNPFNLEAKQEVPFPKPMVSKKNQRIVFFISPCVGVQLNTIDVNEHLERPCFLQVWSMNEFEDITSTVNIDI